MVKVIHVEVEATRTGKSFTVYASDFGYTDEEWDKEDREVKEAILLGYADENLKKESFTMVDFYTKTV